MIIITVADADDVDYVEFFFYLIYKVNGVRIHPPHPLIHNQSKMCARDLFIEIK